MGSHFGQVQVEDQVGDQVGDRAEDRAEDRVEDQVEDQVRDQHRALETRHICSLLLLGQSFCRHISCSHHEL